jgi:putative toxin-antitoxin system antitoxin component (TIGR02293 family)
MTAIREYSPVEAPPDIWAELHLPDEDSKVRDMINTGFKVSLFNSVTNTVGISSTALSQALNIASSTLARRRKEGHFNREESDRIYRLVEVTDRATDLFEGDRAAAVQWMQKAIPALGNKKPIEMLNTAADTLAVLKLILRLEYGVHS